MQLCEICAHNHDPQLYRRQTLLNTIIAKCDKNSVNTLGRQEAPIPTLQQMSQSIHISDAFNFEDDDDELPDEDFLDSITNKQGETTLPTEIEKLDPTTLE